MLTKRLGFLLTSLVTALNYFLLRGRRAGGGVAQASVAAKWVALFSLIYLVLLPLGGYPPARPNILRYDTMIPVTLCLMSLLAYTNLLVVQYARRERLRWYVPVLVAVGLALENADRGEFDQNARQRTLIAELQRAPASSTAVLSDDATVLSWRPVRQAEGSKQSVALLRRWRVLELDLRYVQPPR